jgi:hypothetical protein
MRTRNTDGTFIKASPSVSPSESPNSEEQEEVTTNALMSKIAELQVCVCVCCIVHVLLFTGRL